MEFKQFLYLGGAIFGAIGCFISKLWVLSVQFHFSIKKKIEVKLLKEGGEFDVRDTMITWSRFTSKRISYYIICQLFHSP